VLVVGPPTLDPRGFPFREGASPPEEILGPLWQGVQSLPPARAEVVVVGRIFARLNVEAMLPHIESAIEGWRPDLIVREPNEYASAIAAERHGMPHVRVAIGLALTEQGALMLAATALESTAPGIVEPIAASRYLSCFPELLDQAPITVERYRDPAVDTPSEKLPDRWPGDDSPLVYLSFGSVAAAFASAAEAYRAAVEQLALLPVRVLLTLGRDLELGPVPANVHVEQWVPQADVLDHADAVVCHGGSGTTLGALAYGVPLVVTPLFADQPYNEGKLLDVADDVIDLEAEILGALLGGLDQNGREIEPGHASSGGTGTLGDRARAGGEIEPAVALPGRQCLDHALVDVPERLRDPLVGALAPHHTLPLLQLLERHSRLLGLVTA
jgi:hypothetical protein